ncbi:MAG: PEGA domain-containing protein [Bacteroidota bacterium]
MKYFLPLFLLCFLSGKVCNAQETGELRVIVGNPGALLKVNNQLYHLDKEPTPLQIYLPGGTYEVQLWAPQFEWYKEEVTIVNGEIFPLRKNLQLSEEFKIYKEAQERYSSKKFEQVALNVGAVAGHAALLWVVLDGGSLGRIRNYKKNAEVVLDEYYATLNPNEIDAISDDHQRIVDQHDDAKRLLEVKRYVGIPLTIASAVFTFRQLKKYNKRIKAMEKPVYEEKNPFLSRVELTGSTNQFGFILNF